jgi:hypothetical protein
MDQDENANTFCHFYNGEEIMGKRTISVHDFQKYLKQGV